MTYDPYLLDPEPAPAAQRRSDGTWACVRADYLAGASAPLIAERYGVSVSAIRVRARAEGWRRADLPDPAPAAGRDDEADLAEADASPTELRAVAWARAATAVRRGRLAEALGWTRLVRQLDALAEKEAASPVLQARAAASLARATDTLASLRRDRLTPAKVQDPILPCAAGAGEGDRAQPGGEGDPPSTSPAEPAPSIGLTAASSPAAAPRGRTEMYEMHDMHDMHDMHASKVLSCAAGAGAADRAERGGGGDPHATSGGDLAPSVGLAAATSPVAAPQGRSDEPLHRPPTGPVHPLIPPAWVRRALGAR